MAKHQDGISWDEVIRETMGKYDEGRKGKQVVFIDIEQLDKESHTAMEIIILEARNVERVRNRHEVSSFQNW